MASPYVEVQDISLGMESIWQRLHVTCNLVRSCARRRRCRSKLSEVVTCEYTIHLLAAALKSVASLPRNWCRCFTFRWNAIQFVCTKIHCYAVKDVGMINCKNLTVDDLRRYVFYFYVLWYIYIVLFRKFCVWFYYSGISSGSVYVLLLPELRKLL